MMTSDKIPQVDTLICDFVGGSVGHRFRHGGGRGQALPKAIGMKGGKNPKVVDATAGLGRDSFLLASLGAEVIMIERSAHMHKLLTDGMARAKDAGGDVAEVMKRMSLLHGDSKEILPSLSPEIILIDPMHPPRTTSSLVKKEMRLTREIVGLDEDSADLAKIALGCASNRVVLKWPRRADPIPDIRAPSHQIIGKSTRYDVFMITK